MGAEQGFAARANAEGGGVLGQKQDRWVDGFEIEFEGSVESWGGITNDGDGVSDAFCGDTAESGAGPGAAVVGVQGGAA